MKAPALVALVALVLIGTGCDTNEAPLLSTPQQQVDRLDGAWFVELGQFCAYGFVIADGNLEERKICDIGGGDLGMQVRGGTYLIVGTAISLTLTYSTCVTDTRETFSISYDLSGDTLTMLFTEQIVILKRVEQTDDIPGAIINLGCFIDSESFQRGPVLSL